MSPQRQQHRKTYHKKANINKVVVLGSQKGRTASVLEKYDFLPGLKLFFKCENLQKTGAFKARGACNAILKAKEELGIGLKG